MDKNYYSVSNENPLVNGQVIMPDHSLQYDDILKFSGVREVTALELTVAQGREDSVDMNNGCSDIDLRGDFGYGGGGNQVITIKGGSKNISIFGCLHSRGKETDVDIGNWSDQSYNKSEVVRLNLVHVDGKPVRVRIGRAKGVELIGKYEVSKFENFKLVAYWWIKWCVRKLKGIKVGESGGL
jgi:hypothetical protein